MERAEPITEGLADSYPYSPAVVGVVPATPGSVPHSWRASAVSGCYLTAA